MASSQTLTFPYWLCGSPDWNPVGYNGSATVSVSRAFGSTKAKVSVSSNIYTSGGDTSSWTLMVQVGSNDAVSSTFSGGTFHAQYGTYSASLNTDVSVENTAGTLTVKVWVKINSSSATYGTTSSVQSATVTYDSIGIAKINSCSNMTIGSAVNIGWTAYSTSMYYWFKFECGSFSAWSDRIIVSSTEAQTFTNYTVPASIASSMSAWSTSDNIKVSLVTYSDYDGTKEIGRTSTTVKVSTTQGQAATIQPEWTLKETNTKNPFRQTTKDIGGDGTYRFVKNISKLKLTVYAYSAYGAIPTYLSGGFNALTFSNADFISTGSKENGYDQYKAEITFTPNNDGPAHWWWFYVHDSRGYLTPMVADSSGMFTVKNDSSGNVYMLLNVADYAAPQLTALKVSRSGTVASVVASTVVTDITNTSGTSINSLTATLTRKKTSTGDSTSTDVTSKLGLGEKSDITLASDNLIDLDSNSYEYTLTLTDKYTSVSKTTGTGVIALSFYKGGKGVSFFREANESDEGYVSMWGNGFYVHNADAATGGGISLEMSTAGNKGLYAWGSGDWDEQWLAYYSQKNGMFQIPNWANIGYEANTEPMYPVTFSEIGAPQVVRPIQKSTYAFGSDTYGYVWFCVYGHVVNFYGTIKGMTASASSYTCAFTLPEELRPWMAYQIFPAYNKAAPYAVNWYSSCWISKAGKMIIYKNSAQSITEVYVCGSFISLDPTAVTNS